MSIRITKAEARKLFGGKPVPDVLRKAGKAKRPPSPEALARVGIWAMAESAKITPRRAFMVARLPNPNNSVKQGGAFWAARRELKRVRALAAAECQAARVVKRRPVVVTLTRLSAGTMDAHDNLRAALKPVADGVADYFGAKNDRDGFEWKYEQGEAPWGCFGCVVEFAYPKGRK